MTDSPSVEQILKKYGILTSGTLVVDESNQEKNYVFVLIERDKENKQAPSNKTLSSAKEEIEQHGGKIEIILVDHLQHDLEVGLRATLLHAFSDSIRNAFLSIENSNARIWIDQKKMIDGDLLGDIKEKSSIFLTQVGISLSEITTTSGQNIPTKTACIRAIRQLSPVSFASLSQNLQSLNFTIPSDDWLSRRLDSLRKSGHIIRLSNGNYALTLMALKAHGTLKNKMSPDLKRMLALARREP